MHGAGRVACAVDARDCGLLAGLQLHMRPGHAVLESAAELVGQIAGGGWALSRALAEVSLLDIYRALGDPRLFAIGLAEDAPSCLVEEAVNAAVADTLAAAEALVIARFGEVTLADIARDFDARFAAVMGEG